MVLVVPNQTQNRFYLFSGLSHKVRYALPNDHGGHVGVGAGTQGADVGRLPSGSTPAAPGKPDIDLAGPVSAVPEA